MTLSELWLCPMLSLPGELQHPKPLIRDGRPKRIKRGSDKPPFLGESAFLSSALMLVILQGTHDSRQLVRDGGGCHTSGHPQECCKLARGQQHATHSLTQFPGHVG